MHTDSCFPTAEMICLLLTDDAALEAMRYGCRCDHDDGFLCEHRAKWFAERIAGCMPTCEE